MVLSDLGASRFTFQGNGTQITLSLIDPQMTLDYQDTQVHKVFTGKEIRVQESELGELFTVTLHKSPADTPSFLFTLLLPRVNRRGSMQQDFTTLGIKTENLSTANIIKEGAQKLYEILPFLGTAQAEG